MRLKDAHKPIFSLLLCLTILENWGNPFPEKYLDFLSTKLQFPGDKREVKNEELILIILYLI